MLAIHPGRILKRELEARNMSANQLALALHVPSGRITSILNEERSITSDTALRLGRYLGNSALFWMNLQSQYELAKTEEKSGDKIAREVRQAASQ